ncbi:hypothetical protein CLV51_10477 [Chitinophaga niastensis]|uniref:Alpha/beta superfamily hydrolase n=1 Tax=Chitinophaga niastensis TaxID=536980 RepID=A0A2P8HGN0_CHINA|nr:alpha/beta hydrolase-fold protein [Chitinophaga niastensis]PSL45375.1 hypothetical protein CLV51_10477 [Chitinophaga niastensis]
MKTSVILSALLFAGNMAMAQRTVSTEKNEHNPFVLGIVDKIESVQLAETRTLNIYLPEDYDKDTATTYPVVYLLDGSANEDFVHIAGLVQFLTTIKVMPPSIVVGIANVDRKRDFTHPTTVKKDLKILPTSGGSQKFMLFIEKDLQPYIQQNYRTNAQKTIIGQSLGGLLATEILLKKPDLFDNYLIVSPSLWWNDESLLSEAKALLQIHAKKSIRVYVALGNEGLQMKRDVDKFVDILQTDADKQIKVTYTTFPDESHLTILHRSIYKGFEVLYQQ